MKPRKEDKDDNGYLKRRIFDIKTIIVMFTAMGGAGSITGLTSYLTDPNIAVQTKVERMETESKAHELKFQALKSEVKLKSARVESYIQSDKEKEDLRQQIIDNEFKHIRELLIDIKSDLEDIKNGH